MPRNDTRVAVRRAYLALRDPTPSEEAQVLDFLLTRVLRRRLELFHAGQRVCIYCNADRNPHIHLPGGMVEFICDAHRPTAYDFGNHVDCETLRASRELGETLVDDDDVGDPRAVAKLAAHLERPGGDEHVSGDEDDPNVLAALDGPQDDLEDEEANDEEDEQDDAARVTLRDLGVSHIFDPFGEGAEPVQDAADVRGLSGDSDDC